MLVAKMRPRVRPLMKHQWSYIEWGLSMRIQHPGCFMEMRLGKTLANIRLIQMWNVTGPCLVTAPVTVLNAWEKELRLEGEEYTVISGRPKQDRIEKCVEAFTPGKGRHWCLINYESLVHTAGLATLPWDVVILDESTRIKNPQTKITKLCLTQFRNVKHRIVLSGLPSPEGPTDLFTQMAFLTGEFMGYKSFWRWRADLFQPSLDGVTDWQPKRGISEKIKRAVHRQSYIMRRVDAGLHGKKMRETLSVPMDKDQIKIYKQLEREFAAWVEQEDGYKELRETDHAVVKDIWCARVAGGFDVEKNEKWKNKQKELVSLLNGDLKGQPVVIWYRFNAELESDLQALHSSGIEARALTGESTKPVRDKTLEWFQTSKNGRRALLCQVMLAKYGVDCSAADTAIYRSMAWSGEAIGQSEDRIYHPMKKSPLLYIYFLSQNTIDEDIMYAVNSKVTDAKLFMTKFRESFQKRTGS